MTPAALWLARFSTIARSMGIFASWDAEVLLEGTILQLPGHPGLDMLMELTAVDATLFALSLSDNLPSSFEGIGANASCVERHLCAMDGAIHQVEVGRTEAQAARVNLVEIAKYFELKLSGESWERVSMAASRYGR
jgi:hypothetical protein